MNRKPQVRHSPGAPATAEFLVTGASTGIGRATALLLARHGHRVQAGVRTIRDAPQHDLITAVQLDVTDPEDIAAAAARSAPLAGLINNAGTTIGGPLEVLPISQLREQIEINTIGSLAVTQAFLPALREGSGRIVTISSVAGFMSTPLLGAFSASKFALEALMDALRRELKPSGMPVVIIQPGTIRTANHQKTAVQVDQNRREWGELASRRYGPMVDRYAAMMHDLVAKGSTPEEVATVIEHALVTPRPKARYLVGANARMNAAMCRLLPTGLIDAAIVQAFGGSNQPSASPTRSVIGSRQGEVV